MAAFKPRSHDLKLKAKLYANALIKQRHATLFASAAAVNLHTPISHNELQCRHSNDGMHG